MAVQQIGVGELAKMRERGAAMVLLDVREPWEHDLAAIEGSVLIPLGELSERVSELTVPDGAPVVVYCHHGVRSLSGAAIVRSACAAEAWSLAGGIDAWSRLVDPAVPRY